MVRLGNGSQVRNNSPSSGERIMDRETNEAHHIIDIQEELGISFNGVGGEEVQWVMEMEDRDRREKLAWEHNN
ncbi:hypothetical protein A2U01_0051906, partial [Trifolium medium]|nr:hypothetical protein [Trifolium medium]